MNSKIEEHGEGRVAAVKDVIYLELKSFEQNSFQGKMYCCVSQIFSGDEGTDGVKVWY